MATFRIGDSVSFCASIWDFCGETSNLYFIGDINAAIGACNINIKPPACLDLSGIQLEFQWVNSRGSTETFTCNPSVQLKVLGSAITDSQGKAGITYTITQSDLDLFNANPIFDIRVCIKNKTSGEVVAFGKVRDNFHAGDNIVIAPPLPPTSPTHVIKFKMSSYDSVAYIQQKIVDISGSIAAKIMPSSVIQYVKTEYNTTDGTLDMYIIYTGTSLSITSPQSASVPGELDIVPYAEAALIIIGLVIAGIIFVMALGAPITGGYSLLVVAAAIATAITLFAVNAYWIVYLTTNSTTQEKIIENKTADDKGKSDLDAIKTELADLFSKGEIICQVYIQGLQNAVIKYANKKIADFPLIQINNEINTYKSCSDSIIASIGNDCSIPIASMTVCESALTTKINNEITTKYGTGTYVPPDCSSYSLVDICKSNNTCMWYYDECISKKSCIIQMPFSNDCALNSSSVWKGAGYVVGAAIIGVVAFIYVPPVINIVGGAVSEVQGKIDEWSKLGKESVKSKKEEWKTLTKNKK